MSTLEREATSSNTRALMDFLRQYAPFNQMELTHLALLVQCCHLHYFADSDTVLDPGGGAVERFYIVKQGRIRGVRPAPQGEALLTTFEITQGECFPLAALLGERATRTRHLAVGDTFCLSLMRADFIKVFTESETFRDYCLRGVSSLLDQVNRQVRKQALQNVGEAANLDLPLSRYTQRQLIQGPPSLSVQEAVARMHAANVSSLIITSPEEKALGIFTLHDLRALVAEKPEAVAAPVEDFMSSPVHALPHTASSFEAALLMAEHHCGHLCLLSEESRVIGVVSERDLFALQKVSVVQLTRTIAHAPELHTLIALREDIANLVDALLARGAGARQLLAIITRLNDHMVRRVITLNLRRHDPGLPFCWLSFGSEARQEQTLHTDQDNAILFQTPPGMSADQARAALLPWAQEVNRDLAACGFALCPGQIMAGNPALCLSQEEWRAKLLSLLADFSPQQLLHSVIFLDCRVIYGEAGAAEDLFADIRARIREHSLFQRQLAEQALEHKPPLTLFNGFAYAPPGDRHGDKHSLELKRQGLTPFVDAARVFALAHGVASHNTFERLEQLGRQGVFRETDANAWLEAYGLIQLLRMRAHQAQQREQLALSNLLRPDDLNPLDKRILREALRQAQRLQQALSLAYRR